MVRFIVCIFVVAPYVGAWIETITDAKIRRFFESHPMWVRGLKLNSFMFVYIASEVAPYVGAWIETSVPSVI